MVAAQVVALAQNFDFKYQGKVVEDGATVTIPAEEDMFGELSCETNPSANPGNGLVLVAKSGTVSGTARMEIIEHTFKAATVQWCMGGSCQLMNSQTQLEKTFSGASVPVQFDAYTISQEGYLLAKLTATVGGQSQVIYIEFTNGQSAHVGTLPATAVLVDVYDLSGQLVMASADAAARKQLRRGVYLFKSGKTARKVVVK